MSRFWRYFHDKLNWPMIFRPGPISALARGLALYMDDVRGDILWLRDQWNPQTADESMIAAYGDSRGVFRNRFDSIDSYRQRVVNAYAWHKLGGKIRGLERILAESGFDAEVWPASQAELWAHFRLFLDLHDNTFNEDEGLLFCFLALEYKAARSIIEVIITRTRRDLYMYTGMGAVSRTLESSRLWMKPPEVPGSRPVMAFAAKTVTRSYLCPKY